MAAVDLLMHDEPAAALELYELSAKSWDDLHNKALCLEMLERYEQARGCYASAISATKDKAHQAKSLVGIANCHRHQGAWQDNFDTLNKALSVDAGYPQTYFLLSAYHMRKNDMELAMKALFNGYHTAMECGAEDVETFLRAYVAYASNITNTFEAKIYRKGSAGLLDLLYAQTDQPMHFMLLHKLACVTPTASPAPSKYVPAWCFVSEHFRQGSIASNFMPLLRGLVRRGVAIHLWSVGPWPDDDVTAEFESIEGITFWRQRPPPVSVAICLDGHTGTGQALRLMAERLAPLQLDYLGYPFTTGSVAIDGKVVDSHTDPPGQETFYTEELVRLPKCMWTWNTWNACEVGIQNAHTILVCQNFKKVRPDFLRACDTILRKCPEAMMHFRCTLRADAEQVFREWILPRFTNPDRVKHVESPPHSNLQEDLGTYHLSLDTWPYNGTVTTIECLAAGLPVITFQQAMHRGRTSSCLLSACGLEDYIAHSEQDFCRIALALLDKPPQKEHARVMDAFYNSCIVDADGLAEDFSAAVHDFKLCAE